MRSMRKARPGVPPSQCAGMTFVEILVALVVLSVGILGISLYSGRAMTQITDNNARAMALSAAGQAVEPLYLMTDRDAFRAGLGAFPLTKSDNNGKDNYTVTLTQALDDAGQSLLATPPVDWVPPLTLAVLVTYEGRSGVKTSRASYTFVVP